MEKNYSSTDQSSVRDRALSLPHFDEDATLLSARPVVPLREVRAETRSRRRLIFLLTIVAASLAGALSAVLLLTQTGQNWRSAAEVEENQLEVLSAGAAGGTISDSAEARIPVIRVPVEERRTRDLSSTRDSINKRQTGAISRRSLRSATAGKPDNEADEDFESERSLRRIERRIERREARRQIRNRREQTGDDLLRIREIFEGNPRP